MGFWNMKPEKSAAEKIEEFKALREQRLRIEKENAINKSLAMEKKKLQEAKKEKFNSSGIGRALNAFGGGLAESGHSSRHRRRSRTGSRKPKKPVSLIGEPIIKI